MNFEKQTVLITGGTGSVGRVLTKKLLEIGTKKIIILSRDEAKQHEMRIEYNDERLTFIPCDVRDVTSLTSAVKEANIVVHAAAFKHVPVCEVYPEEAIKTNVLGARNLIQAINSSNVHTVVGISTDKACAPYTTMGVTKALQERLFAVASPDNVPRYMMVRYGNLLMSRGSVLHTFDKQVSQGRPVTVTDPNSTRFVMTFKEAVDIILDTIVHGFNGDIFTPKPKSLKIIDIANAMIAGTNLQIEYTGLRGLEKLHEIMMTAEERQKAFSFDRWEVISKTKKEVLEAKDIVSSDPLFLMSEEEAKKFVADEVKCSSSL